MIFGASENVNDFLKPLFLTLEQLFLIVGPPSYLNSFKEGQHYVCETVLVLTCKDFENRELYKRAGRKILEIRLVDS